MIEQELRALDVMFPPAPDLEARVLARLERPSRRLWLVPALAVVAAVGALLAIPQTRAAILDFFRIGGVTVERVETQPRAPAARPQLGREVTLGEARDAVDFELLVPDATYRVYYDRPIVNMTWGGLVFSQWRGEQLPFFQKQVGPSSTVRNVSVRGDSGVWITGARHELVYRAPGSSDIVAAPRRSVGNVLIWEGDGITYRLEGAPTLERALEAARNLEQD